MTRSRKRRFFKWVLLFFLLAAMAAAAWLYQRHLSFADAPLIGVSEGQTLVVSSGDSLSKVLGKLRDSGIDTKQTVEWRALAREIGAAGLIQVGEYPLSASTTPRELLAAMRDGRVMQRRFTIVEGWNIRELRAALQRAQPLLHKVDGLDDAALMKEIGAGGQHPEGRFLPETYAYVTGDSDVDVLKRAHQAMASALADAWAKRQPDSALNTPDEMLVLASIVEKETGVADERPQIAGLFERRLKIGMRLQTDPTVIYGIGPSYDGNIRKRDLVTDTPYNTYTRAGLPPTPIAMPGREALNAVAKPASGEALYFVAVGDGSGRHLFGKTLAEHEANVAAYLKRYRAAQSKPAQ